MSAARGVGRATADNVKNSIIVQFMSSGNWSFRRQRRMRRRPTASRPRRWHRERRKRAERRQGNRALTPNRITLVSWPRILVLAALLGSSLLTRQAAAWGNEGHQIIALIAEHYLEPEALASVKAILNGDRDSLTTHDIASEAMWADRYRDLDRNGSRERYERTRNWHFVDVELDSPDLDRACFGHPRLPAGVPASSGPAKACIVDKINQFVAELGDSLMDSKSGLSR